MKGRAIPMPPDFAANASLTKPELARRYAVSAQTITRWRKRIGMDFRSEKKALPADFATFAPGKTYRELKLHYGAGEGKIRHWRKLCGIGPAEANVEAATLAKRVDAPADLAERAAEMHLAELARHYGHTTKLVNRWLADAGIKAKTIRQPKPPVHRVTPIKGRFVLPGAIAHPVPPPASGREEEAAHYLRRFYTGVFHCGRNGHHDPKGKHWRCGNAVLTGPEMIERAERNGWDPDAWRRVAGQPVRADALPSLMGARP